jgi:hypothetical protein
MAVWTIAAQEGTGGARVAGELAAAAGVSLIDREELARVAHELDPTFPLARTSSAASAVASTRSLSAPRSASARPTPSASFTFGKRFLGSDAASSRKRLAHPV